MTERSWEHGRVSGFIGSQIRLKRHIEESQRALDEIKVWKLGDPFGSLFHRQKRKKEPEVIRHKDRSSMATPGDIRRRFQEQIDRYIRFEQTDTLTPQYRRFGRHHGDRIWARVEELRRSRAEASLSS